MITCNVNNKRYIGRKTSTIFLGEKYLGSGLHIKRAVQKYGRENFNVQLLEECEEIAELIEREVFWIKYFNAVESENFYNHSPGGYHEGFLPGDLNIAKSARARRINSEKHLGKKMNREFSERQRQIHLGKPSGMLGKQHTEQFKIEQAERTRKRNLERDPEIYKKVSESAKGNKMMNNGKDCRRVHPEDFEKFLKEGWIFGGLSRKGKYKNRKKNPLKVIKFNELFVTYLVKSRTLRGLH